MHPMRLIAIQRRAFFMRFIMHVTWLHPERRSAFTQLWLHGNNLHPMRFIRALDHQLKDDQTVTPKLPYKLRCSSRLQSIREQFDLIKLLRHQIFESLYLNRFSTNFGVHGVPKIKILTIDKEEIDA